jgi:hypothetical protein
MPIGKTAPSLYFFSNWRDAFEASTNIEDLSVDFPGAGARGREMRCEAPTAVFLPGSLKSEVCLLKSLQIGTD